MKGRFPLGTLTAFNSTRYIRNGKTGFSVVEFFLLSTPHGTLGTRFVGGCLAAGYGTFNSTRYIRNVEKWER